MSDLTPRQERFCQEYVNTLSPGEAYKRAGYKGTEGGGNAHRLMQNPAVAQRVAFLQAQRMAESRATVDKTIKNLQRLSEIAEDTGKFAAAIRCQELIGKHLGMFTDRATVEVTDKRSTDELDKEIARLSQMVRDSGSQT